MIHLFKQGKDSKLPTLLLLHGTGGNEADLMTVGEMISPTSARLGVRGNVNENGMPRFFRRLAEGIFDEEDLIFRTKELNEFLDESAEKIGFDRNNVVAVGYSNGANIAASLLFHFRNALRGAILFHAMVPLRTITPPDLSGTPIFMGAGINDPLIPAKETEELGQMLTAAGANVETFWGNHGHQLTHGELHESTDWFHKNFK